MVVDGGGHFNPAGIDGVHNRFGTLEVMRDAADAEWDC